MLSIDSRTVPCNFDWQPALLSHIGNPTGFRDEPIVLLNKFLYLPVGHMPLHLAAQLSLCGLSNQDTPSATF